MSVVSLMQEDSKLIFADGNCTFSLIDPAGASKELTGFVGDIGYLYDTDGNAIAGRTITAAFLLGDLTTAGGAYRQVGKGWKVKYKDFSEKEWTLYVQRFEPDRTMGVGRLVLTLELAR